MSELESTLDPETTKGVIYLSKIPPFMSVHAVREHLSSFGEVTKIYLTPEDKSIQKKRKKYKNDNRRNHTDGWVQFSRKKDAKIAAAALNNQPIGGKKRYRFRDDLWNIKYLKGFKWTQLTDKIAHEKAERDKRMRTELTQAKREHRFYVEKIEQSKVISKIEKRRRKEGDGEEDARLIRNFKQRKVMSTPLNGADE